MNRPKISFGLTCYNQRDFIGQALDSIVKIDKPFEYEVIVADDGSTDGSLDIVESYRKHFGNRLVVLTGRSNAYANEGVSSRVARNKGRLGTAAWGEYCLFADGDDYWTDTDFVKEAISIMDSDKGIAAVFHDFERLSPNGEHSKGRIYLKPGIVSSYQYICSEYSHYGTFVFRNYILENPDCYLQDGCDDWPLQKWISTKGKLVYSNKIVYRYRLFEDRGWEKVPSDVGALIVVNDYLRDAKNYPLWIDVAEADHWKWKFLICAKSLYWIATYLDSGINKNLSMHRRAFLLRYAYPQKKFSPSKYFWRLILLIVLLTLAFVGMTQACFRKLFCKGKLK